MTKKVSFSENVDVNLIQDVQLGPKKIVIDEVTNNFIRIYEFMILNILFFLIKIWLCLKIRIFRVILGC